MPKKTEMHVASQDLRRLTAFLNKGDALQSLARMLQGLVDPESLMPAGISAEQQAFFKREVIAKVFAPDSRIEGFINSLNKSRPIKSEWHLEPASGKKANLHLRGGAWIVKRVESSPRDQVVSCLVRVLEADELSKLGCCRTCQKFFIRGNRGWKRDCSPKCKATYDKIVAREKREAEKAKRITKSTEDEKNEYRQLLTSEKFYKRLPGGPSEKRRKQVDILSALARSPVAVFLKDCDLNTQRIIQAMREDL